MGEREIERAREALRRLRLAEGELGAARAELRQAVQDAHAAGASVAALARALGLSRTRVYQLLG